MGALPVERVLIVDDEPLIVRLLELFLHELGIEKVIKCPTLTALMAEVDQGGFDLAILDVNLCGRPSFPAAERLLADGVPFFFVSGYVHEDMPEALRKVPLIPKPYLAEDIQAAIMKVTAPEAIDR